VARPSKFSTDQIVQALRQVEAGTPAAKMCRTLGITQTTFYRWRQKHGVDAGAGGRSEIRNLRNENQKLKQIVANFLLEKL
jgi:putative transposase